MAKSLWQTDPPRPGPLHLRDPVRKALLTLRHFSAAAACPPPPAELGTPLVAAVERAVRCVLPDEVLACLANGDRYLWEYGFALEDVADHTRAAREFGCPRDLVAVGRHPDSHCFYCVPRSGPRTRGVQLVELDTLDGSQIWQDLGDWLAGAVDGQREFLADRRPGLADWSPMPAELAGFNPALVG